MPRFFVDFPLTAGAEIWITGENGLHITRSLRMRAGEQLTLCDGMGTDFPATILQVEKDGALVRLEKCIPSAAEPRAKITVYQCLPKGDKLETVVQKSVELGAAGVVPVVSRRCVVKLDSKTAEKKTARLQKIALEAAKQSGRGRVPQVTIPIPLKAALEQATQAGTALFCYEAGGNPLSALLQKADTGSVSNGTNANVGASVGASNESASKEGASGESTSTESIGIFIGPEGGFAPEEVELAQGLGAKIATLGPRILRTETVALAALSVILFAKGEME